MRQFFRFVGKDKVQAPEKPVDIAFRHSSGACIIDFNTGQHGAFERRKQIGGPFVGKQNPLGWMFCSAPLALLCGSLSSFASLVQV